MGWGGVGGLLGICKVNFLKANLVTGVLMNSPGL